MHGRTIAPYAFAAAVGPSSRNERQSIASTPARCAALRPDRSQITSGLYCGKRRVNSPKPRSATGSKAPVFTSIAQRPQLPSRIPSTSYGSSRQ
jgi:hypothetical protein